jgi:hypothetical protein
MSKKSAAFKRYLVRVSAGRTVYPRKDPRGYPHFFPHPKEEYRRNIVMYVTPASFSPSMTTIQLYLTLASNSVIKQFI